MRSLLDKNLIKTYLREHFTPIYYGKTPTHLLEKQGGMDWQTVSVTLPLP